ncbi:MAG TPA: hypothetical protein VL221_03215 [Bacteroidota bacterium]|nr:hypothetical protein [Bacteroidota bacterium]
MLAVGGSGLGILSSIGIQFVVADPHGRRTGFDRQSGSALSEIPSSRYDVSVARSPDRASGDSTRRFVAAFGDGGVLEDGAYTLTVTGERGGPFWVSISVYREPESDDFTIRGVIRPGEVKAYRLRFVRDPSLPLRIDTLTVR